MRKILTGIMLCLLSFLASAETAVPKLVSHFNDVAGTVAPHLRSQIEARLADFEKETSNQVVILTVPSLDEDEIFSFSQRVFETWKLGQKSKDNGVLVIVIKDRVDKGKNKSIRIHTGRGLEGVLPDVTCTRIVVDFMKPLMKEGKYAEGFNAGIDKIIAATKGEYKPVATDVATNGTTSDSSDGFLIIIACVVFVIASAIAVPIGTLIAGLTAYILIPSSVGGGLMLAMMVAALLIGWFLAWIIHQAFRSSGFSSDSSGGGWDFGSGSSSGSSGGFSGGGGGSDGGGGGDGTDGWRGITGAKAPVFLW